MNAGVDFPRAVPSGCLSGWTLSRMASGALGADDTSRAEGHVARCVRCEALLRDERAMVGAAALEALPGPLSAAVAKAEQRARPRWWIGWAGPLTLLAAAAVALLMTSRGPSDAQLGGPGGYDGKDGTRTKGAMAIEGTLVRDGVRAATDAPLGELGHLKNGDRLKLRIRNADGQTVRVESQEGSEWQMLYTGVVVGEGLVPIDLVAERGTQSVLRISICPTVGDCVVETHRMVVD